MERWKNGPPQPGTWRPPQNLDEWWNSLSLYPKEQRRATRFINAVNNRADHLRWAERTTLCQVTDKEWIKLWNLGKKSLRTFREDFPYMNEMEATVEKASPQNNPNVVWVGDTGLEASENQIIVLQDEYRSGYECPLCKDLKHRTVEGTYGENKKTESIIECDNCQGQGYYVKGLVAETKTKCTHCEGTGWITCPKCDGKGSPSVVIPEENKGRPTTGEVVSVGENVRRYARGMKVLMPAFAGHSIKLAGYDTQSKKPTESTLVIIVENDVLARVHGKQIESKSFKGSMALHTNA